MIEKKQTSDQRPATSDEIPSAVRTDGSNAFAHRSMAVRVPGILKETLERNPDYPPSIRDAVLRLHDAVVDDEPMQMFDLPAPDYDLWEAHFEPYRGESWLGTEWLFAEFFLYRHLVAATRYWDTLRDPFAPFKQDEWETDDLWIALDEALEAAGSTEQRLHDRVLRALWGNRMDQSIKESMERGTRAHADQLLSDDIPEAVSHLLDHEPGEVHLIMDNAGTELALDLALVDLLLEETIARSVTLHVKMQPVLVSDALVADVQELLRRMHAQGSEASALAERLTRRIDEGRLRIVPDFFWNTALRVWELPPRLQQTLEPARLVIMKGDANYRRATNDALWPQEATLADAVGGFPAPLLALRTLKSDTLVGVDAETQARLDTQADDWRTSGTYGVAQFACHV